MRSRIKFVTFAVVFALSGLSLTATADDVIWLNDSGALAAAERALKQGKPVKAERLLLDALAQPLLRGQRLRALNDLCVAEYMQEDYQASLNSCTDALDMSPHHWQSLLNRGNAHLALDQYAEAEADYTAALRIRPKNQALRQNLALARRASANAN